MVTKMTSKYTFDMTWEQVDHIIVNELKDMVQSQFRLDTDAEGNYLEPDWDLINSLMRVLQHTMVHSDFEQFNKEIALQKLTTMTELMGGYDEGK